MGYDAERGHPEYNVAAHTLLLKELFDLPGVYGMCAE